jgi:hypothetical protein
MGKCVTSNTVTQAFVDGVLYSYSIGNVTVTKWQDYQYMNKEDKQKSVKMYLGERV